MARISQIRETRALVVGSGIAGLSAALGLEQCILVTRAELGSGSSRMAQGGIAAAISADDSASSHAADTIAVAGELADPLIAAAVTAAAAGRIEWLRSIGARFDVEPSGELTLGREAGHSARRIVHADGDATGAEVVRTLSEAVKSRPDIAILENHELIDLALCQGRVVGALASGAGGELTLILASAVILATGGVGGLYQRTTNPATVTGDGLAAAARAGARLADLEFVQFHPTALDARSVPVPLLSEALRGEGAVLVDDRGERFMVRAHPDAELAPRDVVARAIWYQQARGRRTFLDATQAIGNAFPQRFPTVWRHARDAGFDPRSDPLPVTPAEHYHMGGIATDSHGRASLPGLWAVGEVAATGLHGANRLASNSLLEAMVFGAAASRSVMAGPPVTTPLAGIKIAAGAFAAADGEDAAPLNAIRRLMWERVGLVREQQGLGGAIAELARMHRPGLSTASRNALLVCRLIASAAMKRAESRGAHWRSDYPRANRGFASRSFVSVQPEPIVELGRGTQQAA
jgi:L-aspartate oxidase